jgi:Holliday junction resolvasome RuvABC ATP-dependent DNA helicase subunit
MVNGLFLDSHRDPRLTNYLESGKKLPKKTDIIIIHATIGDDVVFIDKIFPLKDKIYMKLSDVK